MLRYQVQADLKLIVSVPILAESMEDAIDQGHRLNVQNFVKITGEYIDGQLELTGVFKEG